MPKFIWWLGGGMLLIGPLLLLAFVPQWVMTRHPTPDPRWSAIATQQQLAFLGTAPASGTAVRAAPTATRTTVPSIAASRALASPTSSSPAPTLTVPPAPTARPTATASPVPPPLPPATPTMTTAVPAVEPAPAPDITAPTAVPLPPTGAGATPALAAATVGVPALNLRTGPGLRFPVITALAWGTAVELTGARQVADDYVWVEVVTAVGQRGWLLGAVVGAR